MANKITREIIQIDEEKCDGCGLCVPACAEGAIQIIDGKARLVGERFCDGLGACLGDCPRGAISIEVREAEAFDARAVEEYLRSAAQDGAAPENECASAATCTAGFEEAVFDRKKAKEGLETGAEPAALTSELTHWPVQLRLVSTGASFLQKPHYLISADCVPFVYANFHRDFLEGKTLLIGCPKFDDATFYFQKLVEIFQKHTPETITVLMMEIPCCSGMNQLVARACAQAGKEIPIRTIVITIDGKVKSSAK